MSKILHTCGLSSATSTSLPWPVRTGVQVKQAKCALALAGPPKTSSPHSGCAPGGHSLVIWVFELSVVQLPDGCGHVVSSGVVHQAQHTVAVTHHLIDAGQQGAADAVGVRQLREGSHRVPAGSVQVALLAGMGHSTALASLLPRS